MPSLISRLLGRAAPARPPEAKTSRVGPLLALHQVGRPVWTPRNLADLAREGYQRNPVVHRAVRMVAEAAASVPLYATDGDVERPDHPVLALLARPNPRDGAAAFLETLYGHLVLSGNAYAEAVTLEGVPRELYALRPDRMRVVPGADGWPQAWDYTVGASTVRFPRREAGVQPILHLTIFNPVDDHYGLSPIEAAANAVDVHNAAGAWNKALLDNSARPSGALVYESRQGLPLAEEQFERLKAELEQSFQGALNAGRPLLLEGGLDWRPLSLSPKDMDFVEAKHAAAREIALAFGMPPMLLGLPGDNTFANYAEANRSFWRQTVLPLVGRTAQSLAAWLAPDEPGLRLQPDLDRIDALAAERGELWSRIGAASFLTDDEKRAAVGYGAAPGQAVKYSPDQPRVPAGNSDGGQWTSGGGGGGGSFDLVHLDGAVTGGEGTDQLLGGSGTDTLGNGFSVDLLEHEGIDGGHAITYHVAKSDTFLINVARLRQLDAQDEYYKNRKLPTDGVRVGSFSSLSSANKLVNSTLSENADRVRQVASGNLLHAFVSKNFGSITGKEAYAPSLWGGITIRDTRGVGVYIIHSATSRTGFRIHTAYPIR